MSRSNRTWVLFWLLVFVSGACATRDNEVDEGGGEPLDLATFDGDLAEDRQDSFEQYLADHVVRAEELDKYIVEGDLPFESLDDVQDYFEAAYGSDGSDEATEGVGRAEQALTIKNSFGTDSKWSYADKRHLTYCVSTTFGINHGAVRDAMLRATAAWENVVDVRFVYVPAQDATCTNANTNVKFNVSPTSDPFNAAAFYPSWPRNQRQLLLNYALSLLAAPRTVVGILTHELGHALGFPHEHDRANLLSPLDCAATELGSRVLTNYDGESVMHYLQCPGRTSQIDYAISQWDREGAQQIYDAPTNVIATTGQVYARKMSNGDLYRRVGAAWSKVGNPARAFVGVGSRLFSLSTNGQVVSQLDDSSTTWLNVGVAGAIGQIFRCGSSVCWTNLTTNLVSRYTNPAAGVGAWVNISATGGRVFGSTTSTIYSLSSNGQSTRVYPGSGTVWTNIGGAYADLMGGDSNLFTIGNGNGNIYILNPPNSFSQIGGPGAQFLQTNTKTVGLTPDRSKVMHHLFGTLWSEIGGPASRVYGAYGKLYATNPSTLAISSYNFSTSTWSSIGQP